MKVMRFKKMTSVFVAALSLFILSQTAFAADGVADTYQTAKQTIPGGITHYEWINDPTDTEWYVYHNTSGASQTFVAYVFPGISNQNLDIVGQVYFNGIWFPPQVAGDTGPGAGEGLQMFNLPPGASFYVQVKGHTSADYNAVNQYQFRMW